MNPRIKSVKILKDYHLLLEFENDELKVFNVSPYLDKGIFKQLKCTSMFSSVSVKHGTIAWANEADFCPDTLYIESTNYSPDIMNFDQNEITIESQRS